MNFVIDGIVDFKEIENVDIINCIDVFKIVNVYENIYVNNLDVNITNNINVTFEIANISLKIKNINLKKFNNKDTYIYCISFIYNLNINLCINSKFEQIQITDLYSSSFPYKSIDYNDLKLVPINIDVLNIDNKLGFNINFVVLDKSIKSDSIITNNYDFEITETTNSLDNIDFKNYSYIDTHQEFI